MTSTETKLSSTESLALELALADWRRALALRGAVNPDSLLAMRRRHWAIVDGR